MPRVPNTKYTWVPVFVGDDRETEYEDPSTGSWINVLTKTNGIVEITLSVYDEVFEETAGPVEHAKFDMPIEEAALFFKETAEMLSREL